MCCVPRSTPNSVVAMFVGDITARINDIIAITEHKVRRFNMGMQADFVYMESHRFRSRWKKVPPKLTKVIGIMYGNRDRVNGQVMTRENLRTNYSIDVDFQRILVAYQSRENKTAVRIYLK